MAARRLRRRGQRESLSAAVFADPKATSAATSQLHAEAVLAEIDRALEDHELIKVRIGGEDREARREAIEIMTSTTKSQAVQIVGKIVLLYRAAKKPNPKLSNILRANASN